LIGAGCLRHSERDRPGRGQYGGGDDEQRFELGLDILVRGLASFTTRTDG